MELSEFYSSAGECQLNLYALRLCQCWSSNQWRISNLNPKRSSHFRMPVPKTKSWNSKHKYSEAKTSLGLRQHSIAAEPDWPWHDSSCYTSCLPLLFIFLNVSRRRKLSMIVGFQLFSNISRTEGPLHLMSGRLFSGITNVDTELWVLLNYLSLASGG